MISPDNRIELLLRAYEDYWYLIDNWNRVRLALGTSPVCRRERALLNYRNLRKTLLRAQSTEAIDLDDFTQPLNMSQDNVGSLPHLWALPTVLGGWCKHSRRIYYIKPDLQALLEATSLEGVSWSEVELPFHSFAVRLGQPIASSEGISYDYALISTSMRKRRDGTASDTWMRTFYLIRPRVAEYQPLSPANRQNIEARMAAKEWRHVEKVIARFLIKVGGSLCNYFTTYEENKDEMVLRSAERVYEDVPVESGFRRDIVPLFDRAVRVIVGLSLYLKTLPSPSPHRSDWQSVAKTAIPDPKAITNEAEVCTVSSCYQLTREERVVLGLEGDSTERARYQLSCHFREGHWRRPPGQGQIPNAPKTVHVRPTLVRRDRLQPGELPAGLQKIM